MFSEVDHFDLTDLLLNFEWLSYVCKNKKKVYTQIIQTEMNICMYNLKLGYNTLKKKRLKTVYNHFQ